MIAVGLGTCLGNRLAYLRRAIKLISAHPMIHITHYSSIYQSEAMLPENPKPDWDRPYLNMAIAIETKLPPQELLTFFKGIEARLGRDLLAPRWSPRPIDLDLLLYHDIKSNLPRLHLPHPDITKRPFVLWPLLDLVPSHTQLPGDSNPLSHYNAWGFPQENKAAPFATRKTQWRIEHPTLVGILNISPESFSDGKEENIEQIIQRAEQLWKDGAWVLDIGAEATSGAVWSDNKNSTPQEIEWQRLKPVIEALHKHFSGDDKPRLSIDTYHWQTAEQALEAGVDWINDVSGLTDLMMRQVIAKADCPVVVMHNLGIPPKRDITLPSNCSPAQALQLWFTHQYRQLEKNEINLNRVIIDPGLGFGKTPQQNWSIIGNVDVWNPEQRPVMFGFSRKSMFNTLTAEPPQNRDLETAVLSTQLADDCTYLRVHNVNWAARALSVAAAVKAACCESPNEAITDKYRQMAEA